MIRIELSDRLIPDEPDYNEVDDDIEEEFDESQMRGRAVCRSCKQLRNDVLNDNGYCSDCD